MRSRAAERETNERLAILESNTQDVRDNSTRMSVLETKVIYISSKVDTIEALVNNLNNWKLQVIGGSAVISCLLTLTFAYLTQQH